jgi:putative endonuclease
VRLQAPQHFDSSLASSGFAQCELAIGKSLSTTALSKCPELVEGLPFLLMWFIYVLLCENGSFYTGISNNPQKRFSDHKNGKGGRYTKLRKPTKIIYLEKVSTKSDALKRELQIKGWGHAKKIRILGLTGKI